MQSVHGESCVAFLVLRDRLRWCNGYFLHLVLSALNQWAEFRDLMSGLISASMRYTHRDPAQHSSSAQAWYVFSHTYKWMCWWEGRIGRWRGKRVHWANITQPSGRRVLLFKQQWARSRQMWLLKEMGDDFDDFVTSKTNPLRIQWVNANSWFVLPVFLPDFHSDPCKE